MMFTDTTDTDRFKQLLSFSSLIYFMLLFFDILLAPQLHNLWAALSKSEFVFVFLHLFVGLLPR